MDDRTEIHDVDELVTLFGTPNHRAANKDRDRLHAVDVRWLAASPFCILATSDADGRCDASPKGDPPGDLVRVLDDRTLALAERPGNKRMDGLRNILANPHVGLNFFVPGRGDTLRINGRARLETTPALLDSMAVGAHRPLLAIVVDVEQIFFHCAKAFLRSSLWDTDTWDPAALPSTAVLTKEVLDTPESVEELESYYSDAHYRTLLYARQEPTAP